MEPMDVSRARQGYGMMGLSSPGLWIYPVILSDSNRQYRQNFQAGILWGCITGLMKFHCGFENPCYHADDRDSLDGV
ncbi:MAG: hypothetical protein CVV52_10660 [Spirochaetae bacterium HGW-Spirochaetae-8]|jgi:hypothetical protein|nr:MAG: hypothetical protein CVV52_10660 [Spirochaetae bacterium HGW-Spirochaetae-8]